VLILVVIVIVFAPIALIQSYDDVEEAIELANGTKYGLGASVFGPDQTYAIQVAKQIKCGMVSVNDFGVFYVSFFFFVYPRISADLAIS
jgi:acyl-CoA reductase-like NAD-dependent aldehyde dehydrogenase